MSEVVHADIFFFITSAVVVLVGGMVLVAMYYIVRILRDVSVIVERLRRASRDIERDFQELRREARTEGIKMRGIVDAALAFFMARMHVQKKRRPAPRRAKAEEVVEEDASEDTLQ